MYYILHCIDKSLSHYQVEQSGLTWNPLISRIYYGILFYIQTMRCMQHVGVMSTQVYCFLKNFLESNPPETLPIAGPLVPVFKALTVSECHYKNQSQIYPSIKINELIRTKPRYKIVKDSDGKESRVRDGIEVIYSDSNMFLPNMYGLFGCLDTITSEEWKSVLRTGDYPLDFDPLHGLPTPTGTIVSRPFNGVQYGTSIENESENFRALFAMPGLQYPLETYKDMNEMFTERGCKLGIPQYKIKEGKYGISDYLNLSDWSWFEHVKWIMSKHSEYFKHPSTLKECHVQGPASSQIIIAYEHSEGDNEVTYPKRFGDPDSELPLSFTGHSCNPNLTLTEQNMAFYSQLNICFPPNYLGMDNYTWKRNKDIQELKLKEGPIWKIPAHMHSSQDYSYLHLPLVIQKHETGKNYQYD